MVSLALNLPWRGPGSVRGDDVVGGFEVRATHNHKNGRLIVKPKDPDDKPVIFVRGTENLFVWNIYGWIFAKDGKLPHFREGSIYYIEKEFLNPMSEVPLPKISLTPRLA